MSCNTNSKTFLKVAFFLKKFDSTIGFGLYDHHHVLKLFCVGNCCASDVLVQVFLLMSHLRATASHSVGLKWKYVK